MGSPTVDKESIKADVRANSLHQLKATLQRQINKRQEAWSESGRPHEALRDPTLLQLKQDLLMVESDLEKLKGGGREMLYLKLTIVGLPLHEISPTDHVELRKQIAARISRAVETIHLLNLERMALLEGGLGAQTHPPKHRSHLSP